MYKSKHIEKKKLLADERESLFNRFDGASKEQQEFKKKSGSVPRLRAPLLKDQDVLMLAQSRVKLS